MLPFDDVENSAEKLCRNKSDYQPQQQDRTRSDEENFKVSDQKNCNKFA